MRTDSPSPVRIGETQDKPQRRSILAVVFTVMAVGLSLALLWMNAGSVLLVFAGILFASFLDACAHGLGKILPVRRAWRLTAVSLILAGVLGIAVSRGIGQIPEQARFLINVMDAQIDVLQHRLTAFGIDLLGPEGGRDFSRLLPDPGQLFGHVHLAIGTASGLLINAVVILCLGLFFAADPGAYRDGILRLVPIPSRGRVRQVMDEMGQVLRGWLLGQLVRVALVVGTMWLALYLVGLPGAFLLALQAGLSNFIPYIGPFVASVPVALVAMPLGTSVLAWAMIVYFLIQNLDGYVIGPLVHREALQLPPAWTLVAIMIFGSLFGVIGMALATPLVAIGRVAVLRFYVEDRLGDRAGD
ncbi:AI-2E family transporter [Microvirga alba]|uniref:AI-2E family transporter n=1 Tax=Microvirga alba TaxID=2791025 RepID=A0A931FMR2_9HYPH|nr:AI-2E family transporter [Microvirga alba]MBF9233329.1 AI-2E family transporter [Microvirga alba]